VEDAAAAATGRGAAAAGTGATETRNGTVVIDIVPVVVLVGHARDGSSRGRRARRRDRRPRDGLLRAAQSRAPERRPASPERRPPLRAATRGSSATWTRRRGRPEPAGVGDVPDASSSSRERRDFRRRGFRAGGDQSKVLVVVEYLDLDDDDDDDRQGRGADGGSAAPRGRGRRGATRVCDRRQSGAGPAVPGIPVERNIRDERLSVRPPRAAPATNIRGE